MTDKKSLSERDICTKYITPAITAAGWDLHSQIREEVSFLAGGGSLLKLVSVDQQVEIMITADAAMPGLKNDRLRQAASTT